MQASHGDPEDGDTVALIETLTNHTTKRNSARDSDAEVFNVIFQPTPLDGAFVIELERVSDNRGFFARSWCEREFAARGLTSSFTQCNVSFNHHAATVRGMHYQLAPHDETKLVRCTMGAVFDVIVDMRPASATYRQWFAVELSAQNHRMLYIPGQFAHGFQTLADDTELFYQMTGNYHPASAVGFRWNDPSLDIPWPLKPSVIAARDQEWADLPDDVQRKPAKARLTSRRGEL